MSVPLRERPVSPPPTAGRAAGLRSMALQPQTWLWVVAVLLVLPQPWHQLQVRIDPMIDMHVYRDAGLSLLHHDVVYSHYTITQYSVLPFTYPPVAALLAIPLTALPLLVVGALWDVAVYACLLYCLRLVLVPYRARLRGTAAAYEPFVLPLAWVVSAWLLPGRQQVHFGQVGVFLMTLVLVDLLTPRTGAWRGVLVGLATAIKLTPGVFIVGLFLAGRRRAAGVAAATFCLVTGLSAVLAPRASWDYWTSALFASDRLGNNADPTNQSLRGIVLRTPLQHLSATAVFVLLAGAVGAVGLRKAAIAWRSGDDLMAVTLVGLLSALLSPVAWIHHYVFLFPLLALLLRDKRWFVAAALAGLWWLDVPAGGHMLLQQGWPGAAFVGTALEASLGLSMALVVLWLPARRSHRPPRPEPSAEPVAAALPLSAG